MKTKEKFLEFKGKNIVYLKVEDTYWIPLKPICEAFNIDADSTIKRTKRDSFLGVCTSIQTVQVAKNDRKQGRSMTCMPEKYIYGWLCFLTSDSEELNRYKKICYNLLYDHFHGTITNRKELLLERTQLDVEIGNLKLSLKEEDPKYKELKELQYKRKQLSAKLNSFDKELVKQPELFVSTEAN